MKAAADIVILDIDGGEMLMSCLRSIFAMELEPERVIVVDNGSRTAVAHRLGPFADQVEVIRNETNLGFARGVNRGVAATTAPFVGLVNNDVELFPGWLRTLSAAMESESRLASCQGIIVDSSGRVDGAGIDLSDGTIRQLGKGAVPESIAAADAIGASATAALYRREAVEAVAGEEWMLEDLDTWYEDVELALLLDEQQWEHRTLPEPLALHRGSASAHLVSYSARMRMKTRNRYFVARSYPKRVSRLALLREDLVIVMRSLLRGDLRRIASVVAGSVEGLTVPPPRRGGR